MLDLGLRKDVTGADALELVDKPGTWHPQMGQGERPAQMPRLPEGHQLFAGYDQGFGEHLVLCETLDDVQKVWDGYARGGALFPPSWYSAPVLFAEDN
jgi:hypothetical protein